MKANCAFVIDVKTEAKGHQNSYESQPNFAYNWIIHCFWWKFCYAMEMLIPITKSYS